ncbi:MAG: outer membrane beta-barrel protein [Pseudomonadota bacterium]|nr:outer membrane beta-barrel protein [Pseudomonadota bacterium]
MKNRIKIILPLLLFTTSLPVFANDGDTYFSIGGGLSQPMSDQEEFGTVPQVYWDREDGYMFRFALGMELSDMRGEFDVSYQTYDMKDRRTSFTTATPVSGNQTYLSALFNLIYDFKGGDGSVTPYLGAGAGFGLVSWNDVLISGSNNPVDDSDFVPAYQFFGGVNFDVSDDTTMGLEYRYYISDVITVSDSAGVTAEINRNGSYNLLLNVTNHF